MECTSPDQAPLRALGSHRGISNKTCWACSVFPEKLAEHKRGGRRPSPHALRLCHPVGSLCNNTLLFVEQQQDRTNRLSSHSSRPTLPPPEAARESEVFFFSKMLDKCLQQVQGISAAQSAAQFGHNDSEAYVLRVGMQDSVYSKSENCSLRQNGVYLCGLGADECTYAALGITLLS